MDYIWDAHRSDNLRPLALGDTGVRELEKAKGEKMEPPVDDVERLSKELEEDLSFLWTYATARSPILDCFPPVKPRKLTRREKLMRRIRRPYFNLLQSIHDLTEKHGAVCHEWEWED